VNSYDVIPLKLVEKNAILAALSFTTGNKELAAKLLGIGKTTLYRKIKRYNINPENANKELDKWLSAQREVAEAILTRSIDNERMIKRAKFYRPRKKGGNS